MPIPDFEDAGLLPVGIHDCSLDEVRERFGKFQGTDRRCRLFERLEALIHQMKATGFFAAIIVDGSFVTDKGSPNDIDLILVLRPSHEMTLPLRPFEYNVVSRRQVRRQFGIDALITREGRPEFSEYLGFFAGVRGKPNARKGLVRLTL